MEGTIGCRPPRAAAEPLGPTRQSPPPEPTHESSITQGVDTIAGRYKLKEILGRGGVGVVYRANDMDLGEEIAIKVLQGQATRNTQDLERFKREIITARKITHANVIRIHDFGMSGEEAFISMEILGGGTLADQIEDGPMAVKSGLEIAIGICEGLEAAHLMGIIHRDIKPDNVLFDGAGRPKLVDFGLARLASAPTRTIGFSGTPFYVSPEQAEGGEVTGRSDIYSLGVLLFEMFTGRLPFLADNLVRLALMHANEAPPAPRSVRPDLPAVLEAVILRCLQKDAKKRYGSAAEVAVDLRAVRDGKSPPGVSVAKDEATIIRAMPPVAAAPSTERTLPPVVLANERRKTAATPAPVRPATADRVSSRVSRPVSPAMEAEPRAAPPAPRKGNAALQFALGSGGVLLAAGLALAVSGGWGTDPVEPAPTPTSIARVTPPLESTPPVVATATATAGTPAPSTPRDAPRPTPKAATPVGTRLASSTPVETSIDRASGASEEGERAGRPKADQARIDLTEQASGKVKFNNSRVLGKNRYTNVKFPALKHNCLDYRKAAQPMAIPPGTYSAQLYDAGDTACTQKPIAKGSFEVKSGGLTEVELNDSGTGIRSTFTKGK